MPANNSTIVAMPIDVTDPVQLRLFLVRLVVQLDIVLGFRQGSTLTEQENRAVLAGQLLGVAKIQKLPVFSNTISDPPTQAEVQSNADGITSATGKINEIISALETAGILV